MTVRELSAEVLGADDALTLIGPKGLQALVARARRLPLKRARILQHGRPEALLHEMLTVLTRGQYVPPRDARTAAAGVREILAAVLRRRLK